MINYIDKFLLHNKTAFITGGLGLIGLEISLALSNAGAKTIILDINDDKGNQLLNNLKTDRHKINYHHFDVTDLENISEHFKKLTQIYKDIDIWVNCSYPRTNDWGTVVENETIESWRKNIDIHLNSYAWLSRLAAIYMKEKKIDGSIINMASIYGVVGNDFTVYDGTEMTCAMAYSAIKGGIVNLTRYLSSYFGKNNIRVNSICPGGIYNNQENNFVKNYECKVPLRRMGRKDEIASTVLFLASEASSYITGATIMVDGGWTAI